MLLFIAKLQLPENRQLYNKPKNHPPQTGLQTEEVDVVMTEKQQQPVV